MKKKFASLFLVLALVLTMIPASAFATTGMENNTFTIDQADATYEIGEPIMVTANSDVEGAWIGLYQASDDTSAVTSYWWYYVNGSYGGKSWTNGETYNIYNTICENNRGGYSDYRGLVEAGQYKLVLFYGDQSVSKEIEITTPTDTTTSVEVEKDTYTVGETVKVKSNAYAWGDWVGIYKTTYTDLASVPSSGYEDYHYAVGHNGLWFEYSSLEAGEYTAVLWSNEGATATAMDTFVVEAGEAGEEPEVPVEATIELAAEDATFNYGEAIDVVTNYTPKSSDWVGIYKKGVTPGTANSIAWYSVEDYPTGKDMATSEGMTDPNGSYYYDGKLLNGDYTIYLFAGSSDYEVTDSVDVTVVNAPDPYADYTITFDPEETLETPFTAAALPGMEFYDLYTVGFEKGMNIKVTVPADLNVEDGAWVGMYDAIGGECMVYQYLKNQTPVVNGDVKIYEFDFADGWTVGSGNTDNAHEEYGYRCLKLFPSEEGDAVRTECFFARQNASDYPVTLSATEFTYNGGVQAPTVTSVGGANSAYWNATIPTDSKNVGTYTVDVVFHKNLGGATSATYKIVAKNVADADVKVTGISDATETGSAIKPVPTVTYNNMTLKAGTDYDVTYGANTAVGKGTVTITGKGNYTGTKTVNFNINEKPCTHSWNAATCQAPKTCKLCGATEGGKIGHDSKVNVPGKDATCTATGLTEGKKCSMCGTVTVKQNTIATKAHVYGPEVVTKEATCTTPGAKQATCVCGATKGSSIPAKGHTVVDVAGKAATCTEAGLTAGKQCSVCKVFTVAQTPIAQLDHTAATTEKTPATLKATGSIVEKCACGAVVKETPIAKIKTVTLAKAAVAYTGKAQKVKVTVKDTAGKIIAAGNYTVTYKNNIKVGKATATVKFKGNYSGTKAVTFKINPKAPVIKKPVAAKKAVTVKWGKVAKEATGYEVMVATNKKFTQGKKTATIKKAATITKKMTGLKAKKTYFVKVRAYKTVKGVKYYSAWSAVKTIKTK